MSAAENTGVVILAAGASTRLGKPKQLLDYYGKKLLQHVISEAVGSDAASVIVVLGSNAALISKELNNEQVLIVENKQWEEGMASSIRIGLHKLVEINPAIDAVIFMVCDQPHIYTSLLNEMITAQQKTGKQIIASNYGKTTGTPALFCKSIFPELMELKGDTGARNIIKKHENEIATVGFPGGKFDIDTIEDYNNIEH